jgi:hypothetical protein
MFDTHLGEEGAETYEDSASDQEEDYNQLHSNPLALIKKKDIKVKKKKAKGEVEFSTTRKKLTTKEDLYLKF